MGGGGKIGQSTACYGTPVDDFEGWLSLVSFAIINTTTRSDFVSNGFILS